MQAVQLKAGDGMDISWILKERRVCPGHCGQHQTGLGLYWRKKMGLGQGEQDTETKNTSFWAAGSLEEEGAYNYGAYKSDQAYQKRTDGGAVSERKAGEFWAYQLVRRPS